MARILLIEDSAINLQLMAYLLRAFGHTVLTASDGAEGLEATRREAPDLVVCDIQMPRMDGYEVAHQLKREPRLGAIPLVAVTALAMVGDRDKVLAGGFDGYIAKPIAPTQFVGQIESFLRATVPPRTPQPVDNAGPTGQGADVGPPDTRLHLAGKD